MPLSDEEVAEFGAAQDAIEAHEKRVDRAKKQEEFLAYLRDTLIPDLRASGRDSTADDFETCIELIEREGR